MTTDYAILAIGYQFKRKVWIKTERSLVGLGY